MGNLAAASAALKQQKPAPAVVSANMPTPIPPPQAQGFNGRSVMATLQASIKAERHTQGLTQRQLAYKAGVSQGTITRAECHGWVSIWTMLRIIDALGKKVTIV